MATGVLSPSTTSSLPLPSPPVRATLLPSAPRLILPIRSDRLTLRFGCSEIGTGRRVSTTARLRVRCGATAIDQSKFEGEVLKSESPVLVEFIAGWCGPCRLIAPIVDWAAEEYKDSLKVVKIDHDANPKLIEEYKVYGLPTLILFKNGQEVPESRREGAMTKVKLTEYLDSLLDSVSVS